ncbi:Lrp/AsnC family transcriptional regulator [Nesterenkonia populi]
MLDLTDRRILEELNSNARIPNAELARKVGLSPSACSARVRALKDRGIISRFTLDVDPRVLGYHLQALVSVRLRPGARHLMEQMSEELREHPEVTQLFILGGTEDFLIHVQVRDAEHVRTFVIERLSSNPAVALTETNLVFEHHTARAGLPFMD